MIEHGTAVRRDGDGSTEESLFEPAQEIDVPPPDEWSRSEQAPAQGGTAQDAEPSLRLPRADVPTFLRSAPRGTERQHRSQEIRHAREEDRSEGAPIYLFDPSQAQRRSRQAPGTSAARGSEPDPGRASGTAQDPPEGGPQQPAPGQRHVDVLAPPPSGRRRGAISLAVVSAAALAAIGGVLVGGGALPLPGPVADLLDRTLEPSAAVIGSARLAPQSAADRDPAQSASPLVSRAAAIPIMPRRVHGPAGGSIELAVARPKSPSVAEVILSGVPSGASLNAGREVGPGRWRIAASDLDGLALLTRPDSSGVFEIRVAEPGAGGAPTDVDVLWIVLNPPAPGPAVAERAADPPPAPVASPAPPAARSVAAATAAVPAEPPAAKEVAALPPSPVDPEPERPAPASEPAARLPAEEIAGLMARGDELLAVGDVASARLLYQRAADGGEARAVLAVGLTYDPVEYERRGVRGLQPDPVRAMELYRRARDAGVAGAEERISALTAWSSR